MEHAYSTERADLCKFDSHVNLQVSTPILSWSEHVSNIIRKANEMVYFLDKVFARSHISVIRSYTKNGHNADRLSMMRLPTPSEQRKTGCFPLSTLSTTRATVSTTSRLRRIPKLPVQFMTTKPSH